MHVRALMTVEIGTPQRPISVDPGDLFDIAAGDPENLIGRGIVEKAEEGAGTFVVGPTNVDKTAAEKLSTEQGRTLGADKSISRDGDIQDFVSKAVAARAAAPKLV